MCEWTCSLLPIPVGLLLENKLCVLVQGAYVCVRRGYDRGHWRIVSDGGIAGCCVPPVTRLICLGGGRTCEAPHTPPAEGSHGNGCQMKLPGLAHLLPATLCVFQSLKSRGRDEAGRSRTNQMRYLSAMCEVNMRVATKVKLAMSTELQWWPSKAVRTLTSILCNTI